MTVRRIATNQQRKILEVKKEFYNKDIAKLSFEDIKRLVVLMAIDRGYLKQPQDLNVKSL